MLGAQPQTKAPPPGHQTAPSSVHSFGNRAREGRVAHGSREGGEMGWPLGHPGFWPALFRDVSQLSFPYDFQPFHLLAQK